MSEEPAVVLMDSDQLFALPPSKKVDRWLFRGELRESKVAKRNPSHSGAVIALGRLVSTWAVADPKVRGKVYGGEVYFRIRRNPDTNVGIDIALASPPRSRRPARRRVTSTARR